MPPIYNKTWGGSQFWGDAFYFRGWKIQQHFYTKHYRLIDAGNYRYESGTYEQCRETLNEIQSRDQLRPMTGEAVILVHGITRTAKNFFRLKPQLRREGYEVINFEYPSTRVSIETSADYLKRVIDSLGSEVERIHFIVHSMGGLVVRTLLKGGHDQRFGRLVMLGVPNNGAQLADRFHGWKTFKLIFGPAGQQLVTDAEGYISQLPVPDFEFAILSGGRGNSKGYNPLISGDDDGVVSVECTRLKGAADFNVIPCLHTFLPMDREAMTQAVRFVKTGSLREDGARQPIPR